MASEEPVLDEYEQKREEVRKQLEACQKERGVKSCLACQEVIGCDLRQGYVNAVYRSMSKGDTGGFEF
jgi:hypothetical protein